MAGEEEGAVMGGVRGEENQLKGKEQEEKEIHCSRTYQHLMLRTIHGWHSVPPCSAGKLVT